MVPWGSGDEVVMLRAGHGGTSFIVIENVLLNPWFIGKQLSCPK
jgi:hypothetical protein